MHFLLTKKKTAMDAMNEALLQPSDYPGTDPDYNPGYFKGTEPEQIKHGSQRRKAEVDMHTAPKMLPPRTELRSHIDEELKDEIKADKEASADSIELTPEQDAFWVRAFEHYSSEGKSQSKAVVLADRELLNKWPELAQYKHWTDPVEHKQAARKDGSALAPPAAMAAEPKFEKDPNDPPPFRSLYGGPVDRSKVVTLNHNKDWAGPAVKRPQSKLLAPKK